MSTLIITRVRDLVTSGLMTRAGLARAAGLHANTLRDLTEDELAKTIGKEAVVTLGGKVRTTLDPSMQQTYERILKAARDVSLVVVEVLAAFDGIQHGCLKPAVRERVIL